MGKPVKDWGVFKFLENKAPKILGDVASGALEIATGQNPIKVVKDKISKAINNSSELSVEDKKQALEKLQADMDHEETMKKLELQDMESARTAEIQRMKYGGKLAGNFTFILAMVAVLGFLALVFIPGIDPATRGKAFSIFTLILGSIFQHYFGKSEREQSSEKK